MAGFKRAQTKLLSEFYVYPDHGWIGLPGYRAGHDWPAVPNILGGPRCRRFYFNCYEFYNLKKKKKTLT